MKGQNIKKFNKQAQLEENKKLYYIFTTWQNVPQKLRKRNSENELIIDLGGKTNPNTIQLIFQKAM